MNGTAALLAAFALLVAGAAVPVAGTVTDPGGTGHAEQAETATSAGNDSAEGVAPGARFAGVVDVHEAEVEGELEGRAFGVRIARANSDDSKAAVVADDVEALTRRTAALRERKRVLTEARENGTISEGRYRAEMAALAARLAVVERQLDRSEAVSRDIPAGVLESKGVDATAIAALRDESRTLAGPEVAEVARSIAGPRSSGGLAAGDARGDPPSAAPGWNGTSIGTNATGATTGDDRPGPIDAGNGTGAVPPTLEGGNESSSDDGESSVSEDGALPSW